MNIGGKNLGELLAFAAINLMLAWALSLVGCTQKSSEVQRTPATQQSQSGIRVTDNSSVTPPETPIQTTGNAQKIAVGTVPVVDPICLPDVRTFGTPNDFTGNDEPAGPQRLDSQLIQLLSLHGPQYFVPNPPTGDIYYWNAAHQVGFFGYDQTGSAHLGKQFLESWDNLVAPTREICAAALELRIQALDDDYSQDEIKIFSVSKGLDAYQEPAIRNAVTLPQNWAYYQALSTHLPSGTRGKITLVYHLSGLAATSTGTVLEQIQPFNNLNVILSENLAVDYAQVTVWSKPRP